MLSRGRIGPVWRTLGGAITGAVDAIPEGRVGRRSLPLEKGQLRDAVKSGGTQSTHISMIHRRDQPGLVPTQHARCSRSVRPRRGHVDESFGPARALRGAWTASGQRAERALPSGLPTLARLSPTCPPRQQQAFCIERMKRAFLGHLDRSKHISAMKSVGGEAARRVSSPPRARLWPMRHSSIPVDSTRYWCAVTECTPDAVAWPPQGVDQRQSLQAGRFPGPVGRLIPTQRQPFSRVRLAIVLLSSPALPMGLGRERKTVPEGQGRLTYPSTGLSVEGESA